MVTRLEYEKALKTIMIYRSQLVEELNSIDSKLLDEENLEKLYLSGVISVRFRNYVCKELSLFLEDLNPKDYLSYTLKDLFRIEKKKVLRFRNSGKKNMLEFEELKEKYLTKS